MACGARIEGVSRLEISGSHVDASNSHALVMNGVDGRRSERNALKHGTRGSLISAALSTNSYKDNGCSRLMSTHSAEPGNLTMNRTSPGTPDPSPDHISLRQPPIQNLSQAVEEQNVMPADSAIPDGNAESTHPILRWLGEPKPTAWLTSLAAICDVQEN